jgi:hypothetical protein
MITPRLHIRPVVLLAAAATVFAAPSALAATPAATKPAATKPATTTPTKTSKPVSAGYSLSAENAPVKLGHSPVIISGDQIRVRGVVHDHTAGEQVLVTLLRRGKSARQVRAAVHGGSPGVFAVSLRISRPGRYLVRASSIPGAKAASLVGSALGVDVVGGGGDRDTISALQLGLAQLHYYAPDRSGRNDLQTQLALMAYRKVNDMQRTFSFNRAIVRRVLHGAGAFKPRFRGGRHEEGDLTHQVVALINPGGKVFAVVPTSSGKPSTPTVLGTFHVYEKAPGYNSEDMFDSNYFIRGYAIHGYPDVPTYAASHGCLRIPDSDAPFVFGWIRVGDEVDVYYR